MKGLEGRRVIITGAAAGIGKETAKRFFKEGSELVLIDLPSEEESGLRSLFQNRMTYIQADITDENDLLKIQSELNKGIDILINNAGITKDATLQKMTDDQFDDVVAVNLKAVWKLSKMATIKMKEQQKGGVILSAASVVAHYGNFGQTNYVATKAAVIGMTKTMARELGKDCIRVNAVAPGFVETAMVEKMPEKVISSIIEKIPLKRMACTEEIAAAYAFLASDDAKYITGTTLNIDGGLVM